LGKKMRAKDIY